MSHSTKELFWPLFGQKFVCYKASIFLGFLLREPIKYRILIAMHCLHETIFESDVWNRTHQRQREQRRSQGHSNSVFLSLLTLFRACLTGSSYTILYMHHTLCIYYYTIFLGFHRVTPVYMLILLLRTNVFTAFFERGDMGLHKDETNTREVCQRYWWSNFLYINNFYPKSFWASVRIYEIFLNWLV